MKRLSGIIAAVFFISLFFGVAFAMAQSQTVSLKAGFNFISFTIKPSQTPSGFIQSSGGACEDILSYSAAAGSFVSANEGTLTGLNAGKGYIFKMKGDLAANFAGTAVPTVGTINLKAGFNLVGFSKVAATMTFWEFMRKYPFISGMYKWNAASGAFIQVVRDASGEPQALDGILPSVSAGQAYFINIAGDAALDLDGPAISFGGTTAAVSPGTLKSIDLGGGVKLDMVYIPAGAFAMGSPNTNMGADETPQRQVRITRGFYISKYETTQAQWQAITGSNPSFFKGALNLPAENVSWNDICNPGGFLHKINAKGIGIFRLPTEAEWEYACRAGTTTTYYWGETFDGAYAWYSPFFASDGNSGQVTHPVGQKKPNAFGLYDMNGNVMEWCSDWYAAYSAIINLDDPIGPAYGDSMKSGSSIPQTRVIRGGGAMSNSTDCRSAYRYCYIDPSLPSKHVGFRLVMTPETATYYLNKTSDSVVAAQTYDLAKVSMMATFPNGISLAVTPSWSLVSGGGTISGGTNYISPGAVGTSVLQASFSDSGIIKTANFTLNITSDVVSVTLSGADAIAAGKTAQLSVTVKDVSGTAVIGKTPVWTSLNPAVATVSASGLVTGIAAGTTAIRATVDGKSGEKSISVTAASFLPDKVIDLGGGVKLEMVYIPAGSFIMGTPENDPDRGSTGYEGPQHKVNITKGFYMGKYEVTQAQWKAVTGDTSDRFSWVGDNFPAIISAWWHIGGAGGFIEKLNSKALGSFSLPTEAQWEYACRAGTTTAFYWGDTMNDDYCLYSGTNTGTDLSVGQKLPNAWGLYDMSGCSWEWCADWLAPYPGPETVNDPTGPLEVRSSHVWRGGGRGSMPAACRSGARNFMDGGFPMSTIGFRLVMAEGDVVEKSLVRMTLSSGTDSVFVGQIYDLSKLTANLQYTGEPFGTPHAVKPQWSLISGPGSVSGQYFTAPAAQGSSTILASYSEGGKTVTATFTIITKIPSVTATIGASGGSISGDGIKITIPPNALMVNSTLNLSLSAEKPGFLSNAIIGNIYIFSGLSDISDATISVELELADPSQAANGCSVVVTNNSTKVSRMFRAALKQNKVTADIDDMKTIFSAPLKINGRSPKYQVGQGNINVYNSPYIYVVPFTNTISPSGKFNLYHRINFTNANGIFNILDASYNYFQSALGLSWSLLRTPIRVELVDMGTTDNSNEAEYEGGFYLRSGVIRLNQELIDINRITSQANIRHELFHYMQDLYNPNIIRSSDWWDWMAEATAVCLEREMLRPNNLYSDAITKFPSTIFCTLHGLDYTQTGIEPTRAHHGYTASTFLSFLIERRGFPVSMIGEIYINHLTRPDLSSLTVLTELIGGRAALANAWRDFCAAYITASVYSNTASVAFYNIVLDAIANNDYKLLSFSQTVTSTTSYFEIPAGSYPLSAHLMEIRFEPVSPSTWEFPDDTTDIILELQTNSDNLNVMVFESELLPKSKYLKTPLPLPQYNVARNKRVTIPNVIEYARSSKSLIFMAVNSETDPSFKTVAFSLKITKDIKRPVKIIDLGNGVKLEMQHIPSGTFMMGSSSKAVDGPQHQVKISKGFYIGKYELTIAQWRAIMGTGAGSLVSYNDSDGTLPAYNIAWNDICNTGGFLEKLNQKNLGKFRLPTEAEWEYSCRGGTTADNYWGSMSIDYYCWYSGNSKTTAATPFYAHPVGNKSPNSFGLYDMNGNVEEWCSDWYGPYTSTLATDPPGPATGTARVIRGGSWYGGSDKCSSTARYYEGPSEWFTYRGFRVVMEE